MKFLNHVFLLPLLAMAATGCSSQQNRPGHSSGTASATFKEGSDYFLFERVRILDNKGFDKPAEACSLLLPRGWQHDGEIIWNGPGSGCDGTDQRFTASSPDGKYRLEMYPVRLWMWTSNEALRRINGGQPASGNCSFGEPMDATAYLRNVFIARQSGHPVVMKVTPNQKVVETMQQNNVRGREEIMRYGASDVQFHQTAINAVLQWPDKTEGLFTCGVSIIESIIPNRYNGTYDRQTTSEAEQQVVFRYPAGQQAQAEKLFSVIMGSYRTNPYWKGAVDRFWKNVRERRQVEFLGKIRMMDEQTRAIGNAAIKKGNDRLAAMDTEIRTWEQKQQSEDRMHTNFIKTIREVENYRDETGKIELVSGYDHAWSRNDGSGFIMTNSPNFDPAAVFLDQNWKEMKKVE